MRANYDPSKGTYNLDNLYKEVKNLFGSHSRKDKPLFEGSSTQQNKSASSSEHALISDISAMHLNEANSLKSAASSN